jgi:3-hydroxyacyl-[acyl-carrier-protein] dehydratase
MTDAVCATSGAPSQAGDPADHLAAREDAALRETLRHCSGCTYYAAYQLRLTGDPGRVPTLVAGVLGRFVEPDLRGRLDRPEGEVLLDADLGIDSLDRMEVAGIFEDVLQTTISDSELRALRTTGDVRRLVEARAVKFARPVSCGI